MGAPVARVFVDIVEEINAIQETGPCTPQLPETCPSLFQQQLNAAAAAQRAILQAVEIQQLGVLGSIFNPRFETSIYQEDDEEYDYPSEPDFTGKLLIKGLLTPNIRYAGTDQWQFDHTELWWASQQTTFIPKEQAKVVIHDNDLHLVFRILNKRQILGMYRRIADVYELIPFNS